MDTLGRCFALAALAWVASPCGNAATWYVSAEARGAGNGTSLADAWTSLSSVKQPELRAGDTVLVYPGTYDERFTLTKGGDSASTRITYKGVGKPVLRGVDGRALGYVAIIGFEFTQVSEANSYRAVTLSGANGWLIQDNYIHDTYGDGITGLYNTSNSNNIVRCNRLDNIGSLSGGSANNAMVCFYGDSNLIEYNTFGRGLDRIYCFGKGNIVRNNLDTGTVDALFPRTKPYPYHIDFFQSYDSTRLLQQLLVERNYVRDNVGGNGHFFIVQDEAHQGMNWFIIRENVVVRMGSFFGLMQNLEAVAVYNNTADAIQNNAVRRYNNGYYFNSPTGGDAFDLRNNVYFNSPNTMDAAGIVPKRYRPTHFTADFESCYGAGALPGGRHNLEGRDPRFADAASGDYTLRSGSPLRGAGGPITECVGEGTDSTWARVKDAKRLCDGWGIAEGDWVRIGSGSVVQIVSVDVGSGIVTLAKRCSWNDRDPFWLKGSEDVGALPYSFAGPFAVANTTRPNLPTGPATLSASCANPDAVRKVEFLVDGIPVGTAYGPAGYYSVSWASDGAPHTVEARAYSAWASETLFRSSFVKINGGRG